jgi:WD40 repeat protein
LRMWDAHTGKELSSVEHNDWVNCCAYSPDSSTVLSGSSSTLRMWSNPLAIWSPYNHWSRSSTVKQKVETLFLLRETGECPLSSLPKELMYEICRHL